MSGGSGRRAEGCGWKQRRVLEHSAASVGGGLGRTVEAALWAAGFYALRKLGTGWVCPDVDETQTASAGDGVVCSSQRGPRLLARPLRLSAVQLAHSFHL
ncbi:unnamed protein product [Boreogadus saida]